LQQQRKDLGRFTLRPSSGRGDQGGVGGGGAPPRVKLGIICQGRQGIPRARNGLMSFPRGRGPSPQAGGPPKGAKSPQGASTGGHRGYWGNLEKKPRGPGKQGTRAGGHPTSQLNRCRGVWAFTPIWAGEKGGCPRERPYRPGPAKRCWGPSGVFGWGSGGDREGAGRLRRGHGAPPRPPP